MQMYYKNTVSVPTLVHVRTKELHMSLFVLVFALAVGYAIVKITGV